VHQSKTRPTFRWSAPLKMRDNPIAASQAEQAANCRLRSSCCKVRGAFAVSSMENAGLQAPNAEVDHDEAGYSSSGYVSQNRQREPGGERKEKKKRRVSARVLVQSCNKSVQAEGWNRPDGVQICHALVSSKVPSCSDQVARSRPAASRVTTDKVKTHHTHQGVEWANQQQAYQRVGGHGDFTKSQGPGKDLPGSVPGG
jgi:hypothetical protein